MLASSDAVPARRIEERLEAIARELMTVTAMLCSAELRDQVCSAETVERAKQALWLLPRRNIDGRFNLNQQT